MLHEKIPTTKRDAIICGKGEEYKRKTRLCRNMLKVYKSNLTDFRNAKRQTIRNGRGI